MLNSIELCQQYCLLTSVELCQQHHMLKSLELYITLLSTFRERFRGSAVGEIAQTRQILDCSDGDGISVKIKALARINVLISNISLMSLHFISTQVFIFICGRGSVVTKVVRTCDPTPLLYKIWQ